MRTDWIAEVGFTEAGGLYVKPSKERFPFIYREALEVSWDDNGQRLFGPKPREWTFTMWFQQIRSAAREQGVELLLSADTLWPSIPDDLRVSISEV